MSPSLHRKRRSDDGLIPEQDELVRVKGELGRAKRELEQTRTERSEAGRQRAEALATQLAASEATARLSEDHFRTLANTMPMLAWYAHPDGEIAWFNERCYEYTGTSFEDLAGWRWEFVLDPEDLARVLMGWRGALGSGKPWEDTFRLRRHDGALVPFARGAPARRPRPRGPVVWH